MTDIVRINKEEMKDLIDRGLMIKNEIGLLQDDLKELVREFSDKTKVKAAILNKAINTAHRSSLSKTKEEVDTLEEILNAAGRGE